MLFVRHGVLLGILFFLSSPIVAAVGQNSDQWNTLCMGDQIDTDQRMFVECCVVPQQRDDLLFRPITMLDIARGSIGQEQSCQWRYGLSKDQVKTLFKLSYVHIIQKLLELQHLSDVGVYELWLLYKDKCWKQREVARCEAELKAALQERVYQQCRQEQQKQQLRQEALVRAQESEAVTLKHQKQLHQQHQSYQSLLESQFENSYYADRYEALLESEGSGYKQYDQEYNFDAQTRGYLYAHGVDYKEYQQCCGTALQQQFHQEICDILQEVAHESLKRPGLIGKSLLFEHGCNFAQAADESNRKSWVSITGTLLDIGHACVALGADIMHRPGVYLQAIAGGVYDSVSDFAQMVIHPATTISSLGQMIYFVFETAALSEESVEEPFGEFAEKYAERKQYICETLSHIKNHFMQLDTPERLRVLTKFCADFTITPKIAHACTYMVAGTLKRGVCAESALGMMAEEFGVVGAAEEAVALVQEAEQLAQQKLAVEIGQQFAEAESVINKASSIAPRPLKVILEDVRAFKNGVIPFGEDELIFETKEALQETQKILQCKNMAALKAAFQSKTVDNKIVQMAVEHMLNFELVLQKEKRLGGYLIKIKGGHMPGVCEALEQVGLVKIVNKKQLPSGAIDYYLQDTLTGKMFENPKTIFPKGWFGEDICKAGWYTYHNPSMPDTVCSRTGALKRTSKYNNLEITVYFTVKKQKLGSKNKDIHRIVTIIPKVEVL